jgi:hypothetical protein
MWEVMDNDNVAENNPCDKNVDVENYNVSYYSKDTTEEIR